MSDLRGRFRLFVHTTTTQQRRGIIVSGAAQDVRPLAKGTKSTSQDGDVTRPKGALKKL